MRVRMVAMAALFAALHCLAVHPAAAGPGPGDDAAAQAVPWPTAWWPVSTPEDQGMDSASLARLIENVGGYKQDSLTVVRHGRIVADAYYAPYVAGVSHDLRSVTKSVVGTLIAILLQDGRLEGVDRPVVELFADKQIRNLDAAKQAMTVQNLLDMNSGFDWVEKAYTPDETIIRMYGSPDRTAFVLDRPMAGAPGAAFYYNSGNPYLLSALVNRKAGQNALEFAKKELFAPLGIKSEKWGMPDAQGVIDGEAGLFLSPHDMARIGYLYLHGGMWDGKRIIPESWVERAAAGPVAATFGTHYGNLWWSYPEKGAYMARGRHSQLILVLPKLDVVAVTTGILRDDEFYSITRLIDDITRAVRSDAPLPEDPVSRRLLADVIRRAATERPSAVGPTPELAKAVSGKVWRFADEQPLRVKSFTLNFLGPESYWVITTYTDKGEGRFTGLFGLDGVYKNSPPATYGINAAKGRWTGERTFVMDRRILGRSEAQTWTLAFDGDKVTVNFENTDGFKAEFRGERGE